MRAKHVRSRLFPAVILFSVLLSVPEDRIFRKGMAVPAGGSATTQGSLLAFGQQGQSIGPCPLAHTDVQGEITGILSRVTVTQSFRNPFPDPIEAVYTFPLPHDAAIEDMTIQVGGRTIRGVVKRREEAKVIYDKARAEGKIAALLDQERPNIFSQKVANILPGQNIDVTLRYVETLRYENGGYRFVFPMVVGPRYVPGAPLGRNGGGRSPDTDQVPDASRLTPPVAPSGTRAGHDISIQVYIESGVPFRNLRSTQHEIVAVQHDGHTAMVRLLDKAVIPNKDFILSYDVAGETLQNGLVTHRAGADGYFMLVLQPPRTVRLEQAAPKELIFALDSSGSMSGFPIEKAKETMGLALRDLRAGDTLNLLTFSGETQVLFPEPVPANPANLAKAQAFLASRGGSGGTEMMRAIRTALGAGESQGRVRIVCFMTDGLVGNDLEIISEVQRHPEARVFAFGIGTSVNRFLLESMAEEGRGAVEFVTLADDAAAASQRFHERIRYPLLTDVSVEWSGLPVTDVYPRRLPDVFSAEPVVVCGRYTRGGSGLVRLRGKMGGRQIVRDLDVSLPDSEPRHNVLASLWARQRIKDLMRQDYAGMQAGRPRDDLKEAIIDLGLRHHLMTQFTSFVAVEERVVTEGGKAQRVEVPVEMPEGISFEGVVGPQQAGTGGFLGGVVGGVPGGVVGGVLGATPPPPPPPPRPPQGQLIRVGGSVQEARLVRRVEPVYPELAREARLSGTVILEAVVDEAGNVSDARVLRGHPLLNDAVVDAVKQWKYSPTLLNGRPVKVIATITVPFATRPTANLDPAIARVMARLQSGAAPDPAESEFVANGRAELELTVDQVSDELKAQLAAIGFEVITWQSPKGTILGRLDIRKLRSLAEVQSVRFIAPHRKGSSQ